METCDVSRAEAYCRACLTEASNMRPLCNKIDGEDRTLFEVLSFVANINLSMNNKYPQQVCDECVSLLCKTDEFKRRCIKSDSFLKGAIDDGVVANLTNGVKVEDSVDKPNIEPYQCTICFEKFSSVNSLESHVVFGHYCATVTHTHADQPGTDVTASGIEESNVDNVNQSGYEVKEESDDFPTATEFADYFDVGNDGYSPDYKQEAYTHDIPFVCNTCGLTFTKERAFKYHIQKKCIDSVNHIREEKFKKPLTKKVKKKEDCSKCDASFALRKTLRRHQREVHKEGTTETYHCSTCMRSFIRRSSYTSHMKMHESKDHVKFICNTCKREFMHQAHLDNHILAVHTRDKGFNCDTCNISFSTQECLDIHKETHKVEKKHQCKLCNKAFQMMSTLNEHMRTHTGERPHLCSICGRGFSQKNNLEQHVRRHKGLKPFKCEHCERGFVSKGELVAHTRKHSGAHPFVCDDCGKGFTTSSSLVKHRRIHTGERPYACDLCSMKFSASGTLKNHRRTHTGEKPYQCSHCEKAFVQRQDLVSHIRCHTGERPYVCTNCGQAFRKASALKTHVKIHVKEPQRDVNLSVLQGVNVLLSGIHDIGS